MYRRPKFLVLLERYKNGLPSFATYLTPFPGYIFHSLNEHNSVLITIIYKNNNQNLNYFKNLILFYLLGLIFHFFLYSNSFPLDFINTAHQSIKVFMLIKNIENCHPIINSYYSYSYFYNIFFRLMKNFQKKL